MGKVMLFERGFEKLNFCKCLILLVPKGGSNPHGTRYRGILSLARISHQ